MVQPQITGRLYENHSSRSILLSMGKNRICCRIMSFMIKFVKRWNGRECMKAVAPMRILLIEDNKYEVEAFQSYCDSVADAKLVFSTGSKTEGLLAVKNFCPDAIVLDIQLDEGNGIEFVYELQDLDLKTNPYIIVTTSLSNERTLQVLRDNGVGYIQPKTQVGYMEHGPEMVVSLLRRMRPYFSYGSKINIPQRDIEKERRVAIWLELGKIGISDDGLSQRYLVEAILIVSFQKDNFIDMDNVVYPELEKRFGRNKKALEHAMRWRIGKVWDTTDPETLQKNYQLYVDPAKGRPVLRQFIGYYASKVKDRL